MHCFEETSFYSIQDNFGTRSVHHFLPKNDVDRDFLFFLSSINLCDISIEYDGVGIGILDVSGINVIL